MSFLKFTMIVVAALLAVGMMIYYTYLKDRDKYILRNQRKEIIKLRHQLAEMLNKINPKP